MTTWLAPAKLNLFLHVVNRFDDGYHELQTVYQLIDWNDELRFDITSDGHIRRISSIEKIPETEDLTVRAALALRNQNPGTQGVNIHLKKNIPIGGGLGGGSSNAATTLTALNELWNLNLSIEKLAEIGITLGADIPVFLNGKNAWAEGRGEILSDIEIPQRLYLVVAPPVEVSTKIVFQNCQFASFRPKITIEDFFKETTGNDLEETACEFYPEVKSLLQWLRSLGPARMTGSGGAVFLQIQSVQQGEEILAKLPPTCRGRICTGEGA